MMPPFTYRDFIKAPVEQTKQEPFVAKDEAIKDAITGEGWVMAPVMNSSNIQEIGYKDGVLRVMFKGMKMFEYEPISDSLWFDFLAASSKGKFFAQRIKNLKSVKSKRIL